MLEGKVTVFHETNGMGTIECPGGRSFTLDTNKKRSGVSASEIRVGDIVQFDEGQKWRGSFPLALNVKVIERPDPQEMVAEVQVHVPEPVRVDARREPKKTTGYGFNQPITPPYHFVPVPSSPAGRILDTPILHNGSNREQSQLISGELRCTLTALTPLLVGNDQYSVTEVTGARGVGRELLELPWKYQGRTPFRVHEEKKVLEPLRLKDKHGRVLISGASLKGMLRQGLGALLGAPMERVGEGRYSYRPNLYRPRDGVLIGLPAIVVKKPDENGKGMEVALCWAPRGVQKPSFSRQEPILPPPTEYRYLGGLDGCGVKRSASLVPGDWRLQKEPVDHSVVLHYWEGLKLLLDSQRNQLLAQNPLSKDDLIFVEWDDKRKCITSLGHNYQYRVKYADTVRKKWKGGTEDPETRAILSPLPEELPDEDGCPRQLSGVRLFMGYVGDEDCGTKGIGTGNFERLAGRVAFNMAVEQIPKEGEVSDDNRFLNMTSSCCVPLKELGSPKPSAVEFYLKQKKLGDGASGNGGLLVTYGDLPGVEPHGGELSGRKFYVHQPDTADVKNRDCYEERPGEGIENKRAILARFVSKPGTEFCFALRFRDLRMWEIGAVLMALNPDNVKYIQNLPERIQKYLEGLSGLDDPSEPFALKLGHGRPLGLGSVMIKVQELCCWEGDELQRKQDNEKTEFETAALQAFWKKLGKTNTGLLLQWLKVHQYRGRTRADYPRGRKGEIFEFHTDLRKDHAKARRFKGQTPHPKSLKPLTLRTTSGEEI